MAKLFPAESAINDPEVFGVVVEFPSGTRKSLSWRQSAPVIDALETAKHCAAQLVKALIDGGKMDDVDRTNWASLTAAMQALVMAWNEKRRAALYAEPQRTEVQ